MGETVQGGGPDKSTMPDRETPDETLIFQVSGEINQALNILIGLLHKIKKQREYGGVSTRNDIQRQYVEIVARHYEYARDSKHTINLLINTYRRTRDAHYIQEAKKHSHRVLDSAQRLRNDFDTQFGSK